MKSSKTRPLPRKPAETMSREEYWASVGKRPKKRNAPEFDSQATFIGIIRHPRNVANFPDLAFIYANGNGGLMYKSEAGKRRAEGILPGVADITIPAARHGFGGAYIENKSATGSLSPDQKKFRDYILRQKYCFKVCRSVDEQCDFIDWYFGITLDRFDGKIK